MKFIFLIFISIDIVFAGNCPSKEKISPCSCIQGDLYCNGIENANELNKIFTSISKNLKENEKHFGDVLVSLKSNGKSPLDSAALNESSFADITFDKFEGDGIKFSKKAFPKWAKTIKFFVCNPCAMSDAQDDISAVNELAEVETLNISLNVTEIPSNAFKPNNGAESRLKNFHFYPMQNLTIKSNAFNNLKKLRLLTINSVTNLNLTVEKSAFDFSVDNMALEFHYSNLTGDSFAPGSFDGNKQLNRQTIRFTASNITYIPESSFKSVLSKGNTIEFNSISPSMASYIDCFDCRNLWLITDKKDDQVRNAACKSDPKKTLFDQEIQTKLKNKCKNDS